MKKFILLLFVFGTIENVKGGCGSPVFMTSTGILYGSNVNSGQTSTLTSTNPFAVTVSNMGSSPECQRYNWLVATYNGDTIFKTGDWSNYIKSFEAEARAGKYIVICNWAGKGWENIIFEWKFDIVLNLPPEVDTTSTTIVPSIIVTNPNFMFYPNPATEILFIENESDPIKTVQVFTTLGELYFSQMVNAPHLNLPLENWPRGIYTALVATASEKVIIKKFVVQ